MDRGAPNENAGVTFSSELIDLAEKSELPPPNEKPPAAGLAGDLADSSSFLAAPPNEKAGAADLAGDLVESSVFFAAEPNEKPLLAGAFAGSSGFLAAPNENEELDAAG